MGQELLGHCSKEGKDTQKDPIGPLPSNPHTLETQGAADGGQRGIEQPHPHMAALPLQEGKAVGVQGHGSARPRPAGAWGKRRGHGHCCCHLRPRGHQGLVGEMSIRPESKRKYPRVNVDSGKADPF